MKNHIKIFTLTALATFALGSCQKALIETPQDFLSGAQLGSSTTADANLYVNGALNSLNGGSFFGYGAFPKVLELDNDDVTGPDWGMGDFGAGNFTGFWAINKIWEGPYELIKRSNFSLFKVSKMTLPDADKNNAMGQLNVLKAWSYFLLVQAYGAVPLYKISLEEGAAANMPRASVKEVYEYIIETLELAETQLYGVKDANYQMGRISKGAASSLLAKVYLTMASGSLTKGTEITMMSGPATAMVNGATVRIAEPSPLTFKKDQVAGYESFDSKAYFKLAMDKAKEVISSGDYELFPKFMDNWRVANRNKGESIWALQSLQGDADLGNEISRDFFGTVSSNLPDIAGGTPQITGGKWYGIREHWYELFDKNDQRITDGVLHRWSDDKGYFSIYPSKDSNIVKGDDVSPEALAIKARYGYKTGDNFRPTIIALRKFAGVSDGTISKADWPYTFIRYADVLLIYAEANNEYNSGATSEGYDALNKVVARSNPPIVKDGPATVVVAGLNQQKFRSYVLEERRRELALEGNRRWDLIRWGVYLQAMNAIGGFDENNINKNRQVKHLLYPIPTGEINANKLINENNKGW